ncbi:sulfate reduction electron transfer complex DsrMKJOP subunit DsrO [Desulfovibrio litoralis]|uniref:Putative sulfite reductase-associated electron transfer protein DsrO n=1 Tax=Desulfovibrio litoralis DSM 11393 TaxID=1121455 RepID=A0A1M7RZW4_9BACT|nr:4Fe-4S dicluster domain-containing protein [Desulfovibrio litoralis]SHN51728.1 putative sulfite reductase-associated electron transfer protein DsrO [Desulfovibrio litoralis DSM 11393]
MQKTRRQLLKVAGLSLLSLGTGTAFSLLNSTPANAAADTFGDPKGALNAKRWAMVIDSRKVTPEIMNNMVHACHSIHNVPTDPKMGNQDVKWIWSDSYHATFAGQEDNFPSEEVAARQFPLLCNHCENPPCVRVCPTQATYKMPNGIVMMDYHRCIGCRYCMAGCPYGARSFNYFDPRRFLKETDPTFPTRTKGVVEKCTFCSERLALGKMPACVEVSEGSVVFGDLLDPKSEVRKLLSQNFTLRRKAQIGTQPGVYYIL